eukprot:scaffold8283_cov133-Chaetoceros_neogracile.AAC.1
MSSAEDLSYCVVKASCRIGIEHTTSSCEGGEASSNADGNHGCSNLKARNLHDIITCQDTRYIRTR